MQNLQNEKDYKILQENIFEKHKTVLNLFNQNNPDIYIYGCGKYGDLILNICKENNIKPKGFIDTYSNAEEIQGLKVFKFSEIENKKSLIIVASLFYACDICQLLKVNGFNNLLSFLILFIHYNKYLDEPTTFENTLYDYILDIVSNYDKYIETLNLLEDETSKQTFKYLMNLRKNLDYANLFNLFRPIRDIYFEKEILHLTENEVFLDGGGFIGDTSLQFISRTNGKYKKIFLFEPCKENINAAILNLKPYKNIEFIQKGISNKNASVNFETNLNKAGCYVSEKGNDSIDLVKIDSVIDEPVTFIKFDIESEEKNGLLGAADLIKKYTPKLAISGYHKPRDLWELPQIIKQINPDYKIYFRMHEYSIESVFYAIQP